MFRRALLFVCLAILSAESATASEKGVGMWHFYGDKAHEVGATWYYNWTPYARGNEANFVPMIWGRRDDNPQAYAAAMASPSEYLMGPNEPDGRGSEAANMSPEAVLAMWPKLMATGKKLVSPAVASDYRWLRTFLEKGRRLGYRCDVIAVHSYPYPSLGRPKDAAKRILDLVDRIHRESKLPIWLTEFGVLNNEDQDKIDEFMDLMTVGLNARPWVERYAWFSDHGYRGVRASALWNDDGSLSNTGWAYKDAPIE